MADAYIQVAEDGTGKKMQTVVNTVGVDSVHAEAVTLVDTAGAAITTLPVSVASLPLAIDAASATIQVDGSQKTQLADRNANFLNFTDNAIDGNTKRLGGETIALNAGNASAGTQRVVIATDQAAVPITDNSGSLTVDGTVTGRIVGNAGAVLDGTTAAGTAPASALATLVQFKNTQPAPTDAQTLIPQADQAGNTRISYGAATATLSAWSSATALNTTQTIYSNSGVTAATVMLQQSSGTFAAGAITFEVSFDGTNFVTAPSTAVVDPSDTAFALIALPYTLVTNTNKPFLLINSGWQALRIKLSTAITGTGTVTPVYTLLPEAPGRPVTLTSGGSGNSVNLAKIAGTATVTASAGIQKVGISGATGTTVDVSRVGSSPGGGIVAGGTYNSSRQSVTDGNSTTLQIDQAGNLRTSPGMEVMSTTTWTTGTLVNVTATIFSDSSANSGVPTVLVNTVANGGTFSTGAITFEVTYDGTNWSTITADAVMDASSTSLAQISLPYTIVASTTKNFLIINRGWQGLRIKLSTAISGSSSPAIAIAPSRLPYTPFIHSGIDYLAGTAIDTNSGNKSAGTQRVVLATDQVQLTNALKVDGSAVTQPTKEARAATPTQSSVANNTGNVTLLAANSSRLGATIFNDDTAGTGATLKVKLGATASATSFTIAIAPQGYYEVPFNYTGIIDGIASVGSGNARITELAT